MPQENQTLNSLILKGPGKNTPTLVLHGVFGMLDNLRSVGKAICEHGDVHLLDLRNHGKSFHSSMMDYPSMVKDLIQYCKNHNLSAINLIGHSMGGKVAMSVALKKPDLCEKLLVVDIAPKKYQPHHQTIIDALSALNLNDYTNRKDIDKALNKYIKEKEVRAFLLKNIYRDQNKNFKFRFNFSAIKKNYNHIVGQEAKEGFFSKPTLFLSGRQSDYITLEDHAHIKTIFPSARVETINGGHWLHADNPKDFLEKTIAFLY